MGYTHYFTQKRHLTVGEMADLADAVRKIVDGSGVTIVREYDLPDTPPELTADLIAFNGSGDNGHETFWLEPTHSGFQFCKTARKPYDDVVVAVLCYIADKLPGAFDISSDGGVNEWSTGLSLAIRATKSGINPIK